MKNGRKWDKPKASFQEVFQVVVEHWNTFGTHWDSGNGKGGLRCENWHPSLHCCCSHLLNSKIVMGVRSCKAGGEKELQEKRANLWLNKSRLAGSFCAISCMLDSSVAPRVCIHCPAITFSCIGIFKGNPESNRGDMT